MFNSIYHILICRQCGYAIPQDWIMRHWSVGETLVHQRSLVRHVCLRALMGFPSVSVH